MALQSHYNDTPEEAVRVISFFSISQSRIVPSEYPTANWFFFGLLQILDTSASPSRNPHTYELKSGAAAHFRSQFDVPDSHLFERPRHGHGAVVAERDIRVGRRNQTQCAVECVSLIAVLHLVERARLEPIRDCL